MKIESSRGSVFQLTLHAYELSALIAAARWIVEGSEGELSDEALDQLRDVLENYDSEMAELQAG